MDALMQFVFNGNTNEFTPYILMCYMVFIITISSIASICDSVMNAHK